MTRGLILCFLLLAALPGFSQWETLRPREVRGSEPGIEFKILDDASVLVSGANPAKYRYEVVCDTEMEGISAFRLDYLADDSLPMRGPGRADNGNFQVSEIEIYARAKNTSNWRPVRLIRAAADRHQGSGTSALTPSRMIDGIIDQGGGFAPAGNVNHTDGFVVFLGAEKEGFKVGTMIRFVLRFESGWKGHGIGRFRLAIANTLDTESLLPETPEPDSLELGESLDKGIAWLLERQQPDGSWLGPDSSLYFGMTALAAYTLIKCGLDENHPAIRAAVSWLAHRPIERTYDMGAVLLFYRELKTTRPKERVTELTRRLVETYKNGTRIGLNYWGYPNGHTDPQADTRDLSNTQYAVLGLRAGAACGDKVPTQIWIELAEELLKLQGAYGGFSYRPDTDPTASMTSAGTCCLVICRDELKKTHEDSPLMGRIAVGIQKGLGWLESNWSVESNRPETGKRWLHYYLYGLERVGSLVPVERIGPHDWHREGMNFLLKTQGKDGQWSTEYGEEDSNTCFALLFLRRASRVSGLSPRALERELENKGKPFQIGAARADKFRAWIRGIEAPLRERLDRGERPASLIWTLGKTEQITISATDKSSFDRDSFSLEYEFKSNGRYDVSAVFVFADGTRLESNSVSVLVDDIEESWHREAIRDHSANLLPQGVPVAQGSSHHSGHVAAFVLDGKYGTCWLSSPSDKKPSLKISLGRSIQASVLKFSAAAPAYGAATEWARPKDVEISINGAKPQVYRLPDVGDRKQSIVFPKTRVKALSITIRSVYNGTAQALASGFKEIEIFEHESPDDFRCDQYRGISRVIVPPARDQAVNWRHTFEVPPNEWNQPEFRDANWKKGASAFGNLKAEHIPERTVWSSADVWMRTEFNANPKDAGTWMLEVVCDDEAEIWINGVPAARIDSYTQRMYKSIVLPPEARAALKSGRNILAVHAKNTGGVGVIDVALSLYVDETPK